MLFYLVNYFSILLMHLRFNSSIFNAFKYSSQIILILVIVEVIMLYYY